MKRIYILQISLILSIFFYSEKAVSQDKFQRVDSKVYIENTELFTILSKNVPDQIFQIKIDLPESYSKSDTILYPVLYLTDADYIFGIATDMADYLRFGEFMPEIIIVGIAYGTKDGQNGNMRSRDFKSYPDKNGVIGASRFLKFITEELFPVIEANYRIDNKDKTLFGVSAGGMFATYVLFTNPDIFEKYVINSPVLARANNWAFRLEEKYFKMRKDLPAKVYMSMGEIESFYPPFPRFINIVKSRNYDGLELKCELLKQGRHFSVISEAFSRGLKSIYSKDSVYELMTKLIDEKDIDFAIKQYYLLKQQSFNQYNFSEPELNEVGYFLLRLNKVEEAIKIFQLNIEEYPKSANTYDSMADAYMEIDNKEMVVKYANKTLEILSKYSQPDSVMIKNWALDKLRRVQEIVDKK